MAQKFAEVTGKKVRKCNQSFLNSRYPWAIANIDREIIGEDAGLEIKTTDSLNLKKFKNGEYPANYYCQCVHYMAVTGKKRWYLAVLIGNKDFRRFIIERDEAEIAALMTAEEEFWKCVETDTPPAVDGTQATSTALGAVYGESNDESCDISGYTESLRQYIDLKQQIKELEALADEMANKIKLFMQSTGTGESDSFRVSWKTETRRTFDRKRFEEDNPDIDLTDYLNTTTARPFKVKEL